MSMASISDIAKALGKARIARAVDRTNSAVTNAVKRGHFPASWRPAIERLGREDNREIPEELFYAVGINTHHVKAHGCINHVGKAGQKDRSEKNPAGAA